MGTSFKYNFLFLFILWLLVITPVLSQLGISETEQKEEELIELREKIDQYEEQLSHSQAEAATASKLIASMDREIDVATSYLSSLQRQIILKSQQIENRRKEIDKLTKEINELGKIIKKRIVSYYKFGKRHDYRLLFNSDSWRQIRVWLKYQKLIAENDQRNYTALLEKKEKLEREQDQLSRDISQRKHALSSQQRETLRLKASRAKREKYLKSLQKDANYLRQHIQELQAAQREIRTAIKRSEDRRIIREKSGQVKPEHIAKNRPSKDYDFASLKGRMEWPVQGQIVSHFGTYKHPTLKTVTENLGVEIKAGHGSPVKSVDAGQVQTITWQRGRGNIVIIAHDQGFYTVYTHLAEIKVNVMQVVSAGQVIGTVGDSGSLHGPVLHFQIWKNTENINPEHWLR